MYSREAGTAIARRCLLTCALALALPHPSVLCAEGQAGRKYIAQYTFDERQGQSIRCLNGNYHGYLGVKPSGVEHDPLRLVSGDCHSWWHSGRMLHFGNERDQMIAVIPDTGIAWSPEALTVEFWYRAVPPAGKGLAALVVKKWRKGDIGGDSFGLYSDAGRESVVFVVTVGTGSKVQLVCRLKDTALADASPWCHVAAVYEAGVREWSKQDPGAWPMRLYLNGRVVPGMMQGVSAGRGNRLLLDRGPVFLGAVLDRRGRVRSPGMGAIDDLRFSDVARRPEELGFYTDPLGRTEPSLQINSLSDSATGVVFSGRPLRFELANHGDQAQDGKLAIGVIEGVDAEPTSERECDFQVNAKAKETFTFDDMALRNGAYRIHAVVEQKGVRTIDKYFSLARIPVPKRAGPDAPWEMSVTSYTRDSVLHLRNLGVGSVREGGALWRRTSSAGVTASVPQRVESLRAAGVKARWMLGGGFPVGDDDVPVRETPRLRDWYEYTASVGALAASEAYCFELWYQPNLRLGWAGTRSEYARLFRVGAESVIRQGTTARLMPGTLSDFDVPFVRSLYANGCGPYIHALAFRPRRSDPEDYDPSGLPLEMREALAGAKRPGEPFRMLFYLMRKVCAEADGNSPPIYMADYGYPLTPDNREKNQAYTIRRSLLALAAGVSKLALGNLDDRSLGLLADAAATPFYVRQATAANLTTGAHYAGDLELGPEVCALLFKTDEGWLLALWQTEDRQADVELPAEAGEFQLLDSQGNPLTARQGRRVRVGMYPVYAVGRAPDLLALAKPVAAGADLEQRQVDAQRKSILYALDCPLEVPRRQLLRTSFVSAEVLVHNYSARTLEGVCNVVLPKGWYAVPPGRTVVLRAGRKTCWPASIHMPRMVGAGDYKVGVRLRYAEEEEVSTWNLHISDCLYIKQWSVIGPFPNEGCEGFAKVYGPEKELDATATYEGGAGMKLQWFNPNPGSITPPRFPNYCYLAYLFRPNEHVVAYLACLLDSPDERHVTLRVGSDDGVVLWLNGKEVFRHHEHRGAEPDQHMIPAELARGPNTLLVKLENYLGDWGIILAVDPATGVTARPLFERPGGQRP